MKKYLFRQLFSDELTRLLTTVNVIMKDSSLVDSFKPYGLNRDDVRQEAYFSGWKWLGSANARLVKASFTYATRSTPYLKRIELFFRYGGVGTFSELFTDCTRYH